MSTEPTDTTEEGLEDLIVRSMTRPVPESVTDFGEPTALYGAGGWLLGHWRDHDREYCVDLAQLAAFLDDTQPDAAEALNLGNDSPTRRKFLARLQGEISKRGTIDVLRHSIKHGPHHIDVFFGTPSKENAKARERFASNRFSVTRQLRYPLPFIADDLFVNCDDTRAAAGFEVLAELGRKTQVLFFTHHWHLVEIARSSLGKSVNVISRSVDKIGAALQ